MLIRMRHTIAPDIDASDVVVAITVVTTVPVGHVYPLAPSCTPWLSLTWPRPGDHRRAIRKNGPTATASVSLEPDGSGPTQPGNERTVPCRQARWYREPSGASSHTAQPT